MWMCKICGQNNDDSADSCMLCGGTEKEHYTPPPTPKVVVPPPEERVTRRPVGTIDPTLRRPSATSYSRTRDTTLRPPTRPSSTASDSASTGTSGSSSRTGSSSVGSCGASDTVGRRRGWILPLILFIISLAVFYPLGMYSANKGSYIGLNFAVAFPFISLLLLINAICYRKGGARASGLVTQIIASLGCMILLSALNAGEALFITMLCITLFVLKLFGIVRCFRRGRPGLAIPQIILLNFDLYCALCSFFKFFDALI